MNTLGLHTLPPYLVTELTMHLRKNGSRLTVVQATTAAIRAWMVSNAARDAESPAAGRPANGSASGSANSSADGAADGSAAAATASRGYQWKSLFLPHGTELRMTTRHSTYHARVDGDSILYQGRSVSPRGFTLATCGEGRNAWRDLCIRFPGERGWKSAACCRREHQQAQQQPQVADPGRTLAAATSIMTEALTTMIALMDRLSARAMPDDERRVTPPRREIDVLADHCAFD